MQDSPIEPYSRNIKNFSFIYFIKKYISLSKRIIVKPTIGISYFNLFIFFILSLFTISLLVFNSANTVYLLNVFLKSPKSSQGRQSGDLAFAQEIMILIFSLFWGFISDFIGRPIVFSIGFFNIAVGLILSSWMPTFGLLLFSRLYFATGAAACTSMMTAVLRDYVAKEDRGKGGGTLGFVSGIGAVFAALVLLRTSSWVQQITKSDNEQFIGRIVYLSIGIFSIVLSITSILFLRSKRRNIKQSIENANVNENSNYNLLNKNENITRISNYDFKVNEDQSTESNELINNKMNISIEDTENISFSVDKNELRQNENIISHPNKLSYKTRFTNFFKRIIQHAVQGIQSIRNPYIFLSYCAAFVARSDSVIVTSFLTLWVSHQYLIENPGLNEAQGVARGGMISGICQLAALLSAPVWGILADRIDQAIVLVIAAIFSSVGYSSMGLLSSVTHGWVFASITFIGIGEIGVIIVAQTLLARHVTKNVTGSVSGIFSFMGGLGILVTTKIGGWIFDEMNPGVLFYIYGVMNWVLSVIAFSVVILQLLIIKFNKK